MDNLKNKFNELKENIPVNNTLNTNMSDLTLKIMDTNYDKKKLENICLLNKFKRDFTDKNSKIEFYAFLLLYPQDIIIPYNEYESGIFATYSNADSSDYLTSLCSIKSKDDKAPKENYNNLKKVLESNNLEKIVEYIIYTH